MQYNWALAGLRDGSPAYAGIDVAHRNAPSGTRDAIAGNPRFPRLRGDRPEGCLPCGSPAYAGIDPPVREGPPLNGSPAYAGIDRSAIAGHLEFPVAGSPAYAGIDRTTGHHT